ncbi:S1 family peptidase [Actinokineospora bangkokensis]|uniref:Trypsin n=1 Tax=Actinokineospora bangkokensis TaxID=1193682 RepID=A0A1Q9LNL7_9PSEU|nr:trypsin-like serine protease [Actinokineospora bangkokensis]OLR93593.1 trypsin [Actinokineospora bangkokensis]
MLAAVAVALGAVVVAAPVAGAKPGPPVGEAPPSTQIIDGGYYNQSAPWAARLFLNGQQNCTATLISSQYVLTARHCVGGSLSFRIGSLDQSSGGYVAYGAQTTTHPSADLALVRLDRSIRTTYSPLGTSTDVAPGRYAVVLGWGATCTDQAEINCQSRYLKYADVTVSTVADRDYFGGVAIGARYYNGITAGGDSGGPMFANGRQVGVASTSNRYDYTSYTNITRYRSWISSIAGV